MSASRRVSTSIGGAVAVAAFLILSGCSSSGTVGAANTLTPTSSSQAAPTTPPTSGASATPMTSMTLVVVPQATPQTIAQLEAAIRALPGLSKAVRTGPNQQYPGGQYRLIFNPNADTESARATIRTLPGVMTISGPTAMPSS